jgi:pimeloyl-ACP methyl ester carboxylesterase
MSMLSSAMQQLTQGQRQASLALGGLQLRTLHRVVRRASGVTLATFGSEANRIDYVARHRNGVPLVGIHGFGGDKETWLMMGALLPRRQAMYFLDLPGHGTSAMPAAPASIRGHAQAVIAMLDHLGIERAIICGNSMGGGVALRIATDWPKRVAGLILIDSVGDDIHQSKVARSWVTGDNPLIPALDQIDSFMATVLERPLPVPASLVRYVATQRALHADKLRQLYRDFVMCDGDAGVPSDVRSVQAPTLVIHGEQDRVIALRVAEQLVTHLPHAELQVMRGVGHAPQLEAPKPTAVLVEQFIDRVTSADRRRQNDQAR